ncbi:MAG: protein-L-isoaspartate(D-aspartate) O-methyltransferase [Verrucomicrobia bacterium]|jgi:protein-L-isoaspartate(D-aspartate) O-methyltransferase|nr:protein-L-isoaspartate(D-aspartate) O-methyltransferase [Verrucomicrobiota bacterium]
MHIQREKLLRQLQGFGRHISNQRVVEAMLKIPRHLFVPFDEKDLAYEDKPLPIGFGQTISQPYMVATMTQLIDPRPDQCILEIGTGSGYQTAILAELAGRVHTVECIAKLSHRARETLDRLGYQNVHFLTGDGYKGWPEPIVFDAILIACAPKDIPWELTKQLKPTGQMIIPVGPQDNQYLKRIYQNKNQWIEETLMEVRFVPMVSSL